MLTHDALAMLKRRTGLTKARSGKLIGPWPYSFASSASIRPQALSACTLSNTGASIVHQP